MSLEDLVVGKQKVKTKAQEGSAKDNKSRIESKFMNDLPTI